jgi:hypothetical protein
MIKSVCCMLEASMCLLQASTVAAQFEGEWYHNAGSRVYRCLWWSKAVYETWL